MIPTLLIDLTPLDTPTRLRGIGRYLRMLALGIARLPSQELRGVRVLALTWLDPLGRFEVTDDFAARSTHTHVRYPTQGDRYRWAYSRRIALWKAAHRVGASCVHLGDPNATPLGMPMVGCRRVVTCHDLIPLKFSGRYLGWRDGFLAGGRALIRRRFASADHVIAVSEATRKELIELLHVPASRISRVYNGIDLGAWSAVERPDDAERSRAHGLRPRGFLLYVGDTDWRKNVDGMIGGLAHARRCGAEVVLAFAGMLEQGKMGEITRIARQCGQHDAIRFLGYVGDDDLKALYRQAAAHLFPSRSEGFGFPVVEAMASGCPVITTRCGSLAEVAGAGALLVDPDRPQEIGDAIARLVMHPSLRIELAREASGWVKRFSCEAQARETLRVLRAQALASADQGAQPPLEQPLPGSQI